MVIRPIPPRYRTEGGAGSFRTPEARRPQRSRGSSGHGPRPGREPRSDLAVTRRCVAPVRTPTRPSRVLPRPQARAETHFSETSATAAVNPSNERRTALDLPESLSVRPCPVLSEETTGRGSDGDPVSPACTGDLMQPGELQSRQGTGVRRHSAQLTAQNPESQPGHVPSYAQLIERLFHTPFPALDRKAQPKAGLSGRDCEAAPGSGDDLDSGGMRWREDSARVHSDQSFSFTITVRLVITPPPPPPTRFLDFQ